MIGYTTPLTGAELERYLENRQRAIDARPAPVLVQLPYSTPEERQARLDAITARVMTNRAARTGVKMW